METNLSEIQTIIDELKDDLQAMANEKVRTSVEQLDKMLGRLENQHIFDAFDPMLDAQQSVQTLDQWATLIFQIVASTPHKGTLFWSLYEIAKTYRRIGEQERAFTLFQQILTLTDVGEYSYKLRAEIFRQLGTQHFHQGQWREAEAYYQKSLALFEAENDFVYAASIYNSLGYIAVQQGNYDLAKTHHQQVFEVAKKHDDCKRVVSAAHNSLGIIASIQADWDAALNNFEEAITIYEELDLPREAARVFINLAMVYVDAGELEAAGSCYAEAIELLEKEGDLVALSKVYVNRAEFYLMVSNVDTAELYANKALAIFNKINDAIGIADVYKLYGRIHHHWKKWKAAIKAFTQSIAGYQSSQNPLGEAEGCYEFGRMYLDAQNLSQAGYFLKRSRTLYENLGATKEVERVDAELSRIAA